MRTRNQFFLLTIFLLLGSAWNFALAQEKPLKVFVLVGQSNMQGHAHVRTLPHIGMDSKTEAILNDIQTETGEPKTQEDVWISYLSSGGIKSGQLTTGFGADENKIGPELTFGITMQKKLDEPVLIIKTAWGGKSIHTDFRPPSAGPYVFDQKVLDRLESQGKDVEAIKADKVKATGFYYRQTIEHVNQVLQDISRVYPDYNVEHGYELAGLVWFQGWNDMVDSGTYPNRGEAGGYQAYSEVLCHLIRDFRKDLGVPELPFVIGVMGAGGPTSEYGPDQKRYLKIHQGFRDAMAQPASLDEFQGNVFTVLTEEYWDMELDSILARDGKIRGKVNRAKKEDKLSELLQELKDGNGLSKEESQLVEELKNDKKLDQVILKILQTREFTPNQLKVMEVGKSNAAFHYLGCAKILAQIGVAFAEAIPVGDETR